MTEKTEAALDRLTVPEPEERVARALAELSWGECGKRDDMWPNKLPDARAALAAMLGVHYRSS